jgi:hypothetical protein
VPLPKFYRRLLTRSVRQAYAKGRADGEQTLLKGLRSVAALNGSAARVLKAGRWDESKHPRAADGRFGEKAAEHDRKAADYRAKADAAHAKVRAAADAVRKHWPEAGPDLDEIAADPGGVAASRLLRRARVDGVSDAVRAKVAALWNLAAGGSAARLAERAAKHEAHAGRYRAAEARAAAAPHLAALHALAETVGDEEDWPTGDPVADQFHDALRALPDRPTAAQVEAVRRPAAALLARFNGVAGREQFAATVRAAAVSAAKLAGAGAFRKADRRQLSADADDSADDPHALLLAAMLQVADEAAESGDDPTAALKSLAALAKNPDRLASVLASPDTLQKAWSEDLHPRDDHGRFVSKDQLQAAKDDPALAERLRSRVTRPEERAKLDKVLSGEASVGRTKRGEQRHQAQQKRQATSKDQRRAHEIAMLALAGHADWGHFEELADLLPSLTVEQLRSVRSATGASWGGERLKRQGMVDKLVAFARAQAAPPEQDAPGSPGWEARMANRQEEPRAATPDDWEQERVRAAADKLDRMGRWEADRPDSLLAQGAAARAGADLERANEFAAGVAGHVPVGPKPVESTGIPAESPEPEPAAEQQKPSEKPEDSTPAETPTAVAQDTPTEPAKKPRGQADILRDIRRNERELGRHALGGRVGKRTPDEIQAEINRLNGELRSLRSRIPARSAPVAAPQPKPAGFDPAASYAVDGKEPWQMTSAEWRAAYDKFRPAAPGGVGRVGPQVSARIGSALKTQLDRGAKLRMNLPDIPDEANAHGHRSAGHRDVIEAAVKAGKPVPPEVLAEYPDLKPAAPAEETQRAIEAMQAAGNPPEPAPRPAPNPALPPTRPEGRPAVGAEKGPPRRFRNQYGVMETVGDQPAPDLTPSAQLDRPAADGKRMSPATPDADVAERVDYLTRRLEQLRANAAFGETAGMKNARQDLERELARLQRKRKP